jgi:hypothetical protein
LVVSADDALFDRVGQALTESHSGWTFEPSTSPGGPPSWCLDPDGEVTVSVTVIDGVISLYLPAEDHEIRFADIDQLTAWIRANQDRISRT